MSKSFRMSGLVPATFTPMHTDGSLNLEVVPAMVERLIDFRSNALFVCGTTGESSSMTTPERKATLGAFIQASAGRVPVVAHVGHTSLADCRDLAAHAQTNGAAAIATTPPFYFRPGSVSELVDCMAEIAAAAPQLPFYYYHIPHLTGVSLSMENFLRQAKDRIPNLGGIKYTAPTLYEFQACSAVANEADFQRWRCWELDGQVPMYFGVPAIELYPPPTGREWRRPTLRSGPVVRRLG